MPPPPNIQQIINQIQKIQKKIPQQQQKLKHQRIVRTPHAGMIAITLTPHKQLLDLQIKQQPLHPHHIQILQHLLLPPTNQPINKPHNLTQQPLPKHTQALNIPRI
ncbi:YbaB/EbfC family nucleoid-associated protein, partial [Staphylococcus hominis]|uniref:YbaB/EbfC family nucleoid-associated protein n=1 Tax=Staphylococcus hominis TaxID=1290 RepID=UPI0021B6A30F